MEKGGNITMGEKKEEVRIVRESQTITPADIFTSGGITTRLTGPNGEYVEDWGRTSEKSHDNAHEKFHKKYG